MRIWYGTLCWLLMLVVLAGCGAGPSAIEPTPVVVVETEAVVLPTNAATEPTNMPEAEATAVPDTPVSTDLAPEPSVTPEAPTNTPEAPTDAPELPTDTPDVPTNTPIAAIATLVAVQFGTFPTEINANGEQVPWNQLVRTDSIPNAGFFVNNLPEGIDLLNLDLRVVFGGNVVYQRQAPADDQTLFGADSGGLLFADANFLWPDSDGDGASAPIVSGEYNLTVRGETSAGATIEQSFPFTIDLDAATNETPTPAP